MRNRIKKKKKKKERERERERKGYKVQTLNYWLISYVSRLQTTEKEILTTLKKVIFSHRKAVSCHTSSCIDSVFVLFILLYKGAFIIIIPIY